MIGFRPAMLLFAALAIYALVTLKGAPLFFALIVVLALAAKTYIHHVRSRLK